MSGVEDDVALPPFGNDAWHSKNGSSALFYPPIPESSGIDSILCVPIDNLFERHRFHRDVIGYDDANNAMILRWLGVIGMNQHFQ